MGTNSNRTIQIGTTGDPIALAKQIAPRFFYGHQVRDISNENYPAYNRCLKTRGLKKDELYLLQPVLLHYYAYGEPVEVHIRAWVYRWSTKEQCGLQDVTFEQYEKGLEIDIVLNHLN